MSDKVVVPDLPLEFLTRLFSPAANALADFSELVTRMGIADCASAGVRDRRVSDRMRQHKSF